MKIDFSFSKNFSSFLYIWFKKTLICRQDQVQVKNWKNVLWGFFSVVLFICLLITHKCLFNLYLIHIFWMKYRCHDKREFRIYLFIYPETRKTSFNARTGTMNGFNDNNPHSLYLIFFCIYNGFEKFFWVHSKKRQ